MAAGDRDGLGAIISLNLAPSTTGQEFWVRYVGGDKFLFHKDTYFAATREELRTLRVAIDALLSEEPKDHGWKLCRYLAGRAASAPKVTCSCAFARGDTDMSICSNFQKGPHGYCDDCCHDKDCAVHF